MLVVVGSNAAQSHTRWISYAVFVIPPAIHSLAANADARADGQQALHPTHEKSHVNQQK